MVTLKVSELRALAEWFLEGLVYRKQGFPLPMPWDAPDIIERLSRALAEEPASLAWTAERPSEPGWYWLRRTYPGMSPERNMVEIAGGSESDRLTVWLHGIDIGFPHESVSQWVGPLVPPPGPGSEVEP